MCGISGFISYSADAMSEDARQEVLGLMSRAIARRGPDDAQFYDDGVLSLVFRRLSIIDVEGGRQPIWNEDGTVMVAVNGEIYNHQDLREALAEAHTFSTKSDSEVVLHLYEEYGEDCFAHLNGMFAVVLWDKNKQKLILARDRLGIKPLYYTQTENGLVFASELKALLMHPECPGELNWSDISDVGLQQKEDVSSYIMGVNHLRAGAYLSFTSEGKAAIHKYWSIADHTEDRPDGDERTYCDAYSALIDDATTRQLMSDVPVGLFLSGGIDSSILAAIAAKSGHTLHCFTVAERTTVATGDLQQAISLCRELDVPLYAGYMDAADIAQRFELDDLERMVLMIESPRFDPEWLFKYELHKFAKQQVPELKVVLIGQGADEFAGGYSNMMGAERKDWDDYIHSYVEPSLVKSVEAINGIPERFDKYIERDYIEQLADGRADSYKTLMKMQVNQLQYFNLWHEDRTSSYNSLEARVPYLDHRVVEYLASIPEVCHKELFWDKKIVREALHKHVPSYPKDKEKVPFFAVEDDSSVIELVYLIALKLYPDFREKYLHADETIFDWQHVNALYHTIVEKKGNFIDAAWQLMEIMSVSIFNDLCSHRERVVAIVEAHDDAVIRALSDSEMEDVASLRFAEVSHLLPTEWAMQSVIRVPAEVQLVKRLNESEQRHTIILLDGGQIRQTLRIPDDDAWAVDMLTHLLAKKQDGDSIANLSENFGVAPQRFAQISEFLKSKGFIELVPQH